MLKGRSTREAESHGAKRTPEAEQEADITVQPRKPLCLDTAAGAPEDSQALVSAEKVQG